MHTASKPEQIQVFFEIAMSIGSSLDLEKMLKTTLLTYLRKLNCSAGFILQLQENKNQQYNYEQVISIPYKSINKSESKELTNLIPNNFGEEELNKLNEKLPITIKSEEGGQFYLMRLADFGLICLKKGGNKFSVDILYTLRSLNDKLAQASIACVKKSELIKAKEKAIESDRLKTAFIENISHEIRTPLNAIIGYSSLISEKHISTNMLPFACKTIVENSDKLLTLIENMLEISMLESGNLFIKYTLCNINQLLIEQEEVFQKYLLAEQKSELTLKIKYPVEELFFVTDAVRLRQIISYLISNAVRFTENGEIEIGYLSFKKDISQNLPTHITFYVKDTGIGIPEEKQKDIFKSFNRIENTKDKIYSGTGIGLTIAKNLLRLLDGKIWIESEPNKGTTFYFSLPTTKKVDELVSAL